MNMCAVLSQLGRHEHAIIHAHQAIISVQSTLLFGHLPRKKADIDKMKKETKNADNHARLQESNMMTKEFKDRITVLTIAYHNLAVE